MIKCVSVFDKSNQMINEIFMAYTGSSNQRFTLEVGADLPIEVELVLSKPKQIAYIAWRFDYCIALEFISRNESEDKYEQHFEVIISCENNYMSDSECGRLLDSVSERAVQSSKEKIKVNSDSRLVMHSEVHTVYPNSVMSFSESKAERLSLEKNRKIIFEWLTLFFPMCLSSNKRLVH